LINKINNPGTIYIIGAGLAGLSAAVSCILKGYKVGVFEATNHAGGRCRSYKDKILNRTINNGNHLILSGNLGVKKFLSNLDIADNFKTMDPVLFNFHDIIKNECWSIQPSNGRIPWWILNPSRRIPGTSLGDYLTLLKFKYAKDKTIGALVNPSRPIFERLWQPLSQAVLNTDAHEGSAALIWTMLSKTLLKGSDASRPMLTRAGLSASLIDPAISFLTANKSDIQFSMKLQSISKNTNNLKTINFNKRAITLKKNDAVILALPPNIISSLIPDIITPKDTNAIVNVHFRLDERPTLPNNAPFIGIIGGNAHWLFKHDDIYSVTISAANKFGEKSNEEIAKIIWNEVAKVIGYNRENLPLFRVIREMRATFAQTPEENMRRPDSRTNWQNLFLAGDWTNTGLPATIESAIVSGQKVAEILDK
jgi:squalene-associated FAD-dependent desaturase